MASIQSHRDLLVWQRGMDLVEASYQFVHQFPAHERYGLTQQLTRASISIPANIAEGHGRSTRKDYAHFVSIARGSLMEVETYVMIGRRLGFASKESADDLLSRIVELGRMLTALRQRLAGPRT
jgi:four helix bundle protein